MPEGEDPDSFVRHQGNDAFDRLVAQAMPLSEFMLKELMAHCDMTSAEGRAKLVADAKPLLGRLQTPLLRLQLVKRLAETSGFSQAEVERLCELKPVAKTAPARAPRQAPSLLRRLLQLLLQKPELALLVPLQALPGNSTEARVVANLCAAIQAGNDAVPEYASLLERRRGSEDVPVLREAAAELMREPFAEGDIESEFDGVVNRLQEAEKRRTFALLQEKVAKLGVTGLSGEEKQQYLQALSKFS